MAAGKDRCKNLLDHFVLADDDFVKFLLHDFAMLAELLQHIAETSLFSGHAVSFVCFLVFEARCHNEMPSVKEQLVGIVLNVLLSTAHRIV